MFRARRVMRRRMVARTAAVGGAAYWAAKRGAQARQDEELAPRPHPPRPDEPAFDPIEQLKELGELREQGILTEEEFSAEKKKLLES
jgi:Short C-terminal domain